MTPNTAYIDMEFAGIYGTHQSLQIPIEIGVVIHQPDTDILTFAGKAFNRNIEVELWKNITDDVGKRIEGARRVFNLATRGRTKIFSKKVHLDAIGRKEAHQAIAGVHQDLRGFMQSLNQVEINTLIFLPVVVKWKRSRIPGLKRTVLLSATSRKRYGRVFISKNTYRLTACPSSRISGTQSPQSVLTITRMLCRKNFVT